MFTKTTAVAAATVLLASEASAQYSSHHLKGAPFVRDFDLSKFAFSGVKGGKFNVDGFDTETGKTVFDLVQQALPGQGFAAEETPDTGMIDPWVDVGTGMIDPNVDEIEEMETTEIIESSDGPAESEMGPTMCALYSDWSIDDLSTLAPNPHQPKNPADWWYLDCDEDGYSNGMEVDHYNENFDPYIPNYELSTTFFTFEINLMDIDTVPELKRSAEKSVWAWKRLKRSSQDEFCDAAFQVAVSHPDFKGEDVFAYHCAAGLSDNLKIILIIEMNEEQDEAHSKDIVGYYNGATVQITVDGTIYNAEWHAKYEQAEVIRVDNSARVYDFFLVQSSVVGQDVLQPENWFGGCTGVPNINGLDTELVEMGSNTTSFYGSADYTVFYAYQYGQCPPAVDVYVELKSEVTMSRRRSTN